jgi:hypothetical protein
LTPKRSRIDQFFIFGNQDSLLKGKMMIQGQVLDTKINDVLLQQVMLTLNAPPANIPISFFSLIHDQGFDSEQRDQLISALLLLAKDGRILMPPSDVSIELWTPMMSSRLTVGTSTRADAVAIFGCPLSEDEIGTATGIGGVEGAGTVRRASATLDGPPTKAIATSQACMTVDPKGRSVATGQLRHTGRPFPAAAVHRSRHDD